MATVVEELTLEPSARLETLDAEFRSHYAWLVRRLSFIVGDPEEAQDLAQQVFVRAAEKWPIANGAPIAAWLAVVGVRLAISERRRRTRWGFLPLREHDGLWAIEGDPDLWRALSRLDERTRAALLLTILDGFTQDEVAQSFGVPRGTVASWLSRAKKLLRPILEEDRDVR
jgi:RNA polymerase sigma factor (sigma-70 family)